MTLVAPKAPVSEAAAGGDAPGAKVLFILEDLLIGGAQRHSVGLVRTLASAFRFRIVGLTDGVSDSVITGDIKAEVRVLGLSGMLKPSTWRRLARVLDEESPALIVTVNQIATFTATLALRLSRIQCPVVVVFHSTDVKNLAGWIRTAPFFPAVWMASAIVYISANQKALWMRRGLRARRVELIRNGIDVSRFSPPSAVERRAARDRLGLGEDDYVVGLSAVFRYEKNHQQLIHAIAALRGQGVPARAILVGDGPKRPQIEQLAKDLDVFEHVRFAGMQSDVRPFLHAMDVGVICSKSIETLSLSALEAMASGLPMIMSDIGGASEIVRDGENGFLFPAGDTPALIDRLRLCAERPLREKLGAKALRAVRDDFGYDEMARRYATLFHELTAARTVGSRAR